MQFIFKFQVRGPNALLRPGEALGGRTPEGWVKAERQQSMACSPRCLKEAALIFIFSRGRNELQGNVMEWTKWARKIWEAFLGGKCVCAHLQWGGEPDPCS